ncbi:DUF6115 domain-containing protein [Calderihabitans maritimus]|uniref:DUF2802 domain-containing protein n=1 Tax=Calderihabitans maritimus TaxID=1246530 RepID=A0A1Z5HUD5_9FIRM|nr:hypothetical protein [Calderihabitans maritimus]GAW92941.1 hypothetical protein Daud_1743 [Calderihabitans maritimus]
MIYGMLFLGLVLVVLTARETWQFLTRKTVLSHQFEAEKSEYSGSESVDEIKQQLELLTGLVEENGRALSLLTKKIDRMIQEVGKSKSFATVLEDAQTTNLYEAVYKAYDEGKDVTEIARELQRGKGEIELILSLRRQ